MDLGIYSMDYLDGLLYVGTEYGILQYDIAADTYWWYSYDFDLQDL